MTYTITNKCIDCNACASSCPTGAITKNSNGKFAVDPDLCNDCSGAYSVAQCMASCPTYNGCQITLSSLIQSVKTSSDNYWDTWFATHRRLLQRLETQHQTQYWRHWFDTYSQKLDGLLHT